MPGTALLSTLHCLTLVRVLRRTDSPSQACTFFPGPQLWTALGSDPRHVHYPARQFLPVKFFPFSLALSLQPAVCSSCFDHLYMCVQSILPTLHLALLAQGVLLGKPTREASFRGSSYVCAVPTHWARYVQTAYSCRSATIVAFVWPSLPIDRLTFFYRYSPTLCPGPQHVHTL